jgi:lipase
MRVGEWRPLSPAASEGAAESRSPVILALHSMTGAHPAWTWLADQLPDHRIVAPDLRGRGRSAGLPAPYGIAAHVRDVLAVLDALQLSDVTLVGHSLGAFVAVAALAERPSAFRHTVLVDGGLPLTVPLSMHSADLLELVLGRPAVGVDFAFSSAAAHRRFWQLHPALAKDWSTRLGAYADYLVEEALDEHARIVFRPVCSGAAVEADARELSGSVEVRRRLRAIRGAATLITAPRGLANERPGIYSPGELTLSADDRAGMPHVEVAGVNHHTIVASDRGARALARVVRRGPAARIEAQAS